jgi:hypothetical protein
VLDDHNDDLTVFFADRYLTRDGAWIGWFPTGRR